MLSKEDFDMSIDEIKKMVLMQTRDGIAAAQVSAILLVAKLLLDVRDISIEKRLTK